MIKFERVKAYPDAILPIRSTKYSGGYDLFAAEDITIPSYLVMMKNIEDWYRREYIRDYFNTGNNILLKIIKENPTYQPTLVPTGVKLYLDNDKTFEISARSSLPRKNWLIVANAPGKVDADYVDNPDNEGHIYVQLINLAPFEFTIHKGEKFAQGSIRQYFLTDDDAAEGTRNGGFGSTGNQIIGVSI